MGQAEVVNSGERLSKVASRDPFNARVERWNGGPVFSLRLWLRAGARAEPTPGLALLTGRLLVEGTEALTWQDIALECERRGVSVTATGGLQTTGLAVDCLADQWRFACELACDLLLQSSFPEDRVDWQRDLAVAELQSLADQPEVRSSWAFLDQVYHPHPLSRPLLGDAESLALASTESCRAFHRTALQEGGWATASGVVEPDAVAEYLHSRLAEVLTREANQAGEVEGQALGRPEQVREITLPDSQQLHIYAGHLTVARTHPDAAALEVLGVVLGAGSGLNGRFPHRLREVEGLGYVAHAHAIAGASRSPGRFVVYLATAPQQRALAERAIREELDKLLADGVTDQEFEDARAYLLGREAMRRETASQHADLLSEAIFYGQPWDELDWARARYERLDRSGVNDALRRWIAPERLYWTYGLPGRG